jgi:hypothetical protein
MAQTSVLACALYFCFVYLFFILNNRFIICNNSNYCYAVCYRAFNIYLDFFLIKHLRCVYFLCTFVKHFQSKKNTHDCNGIQSSTRQS